MKNLKDKMKRTKIITTIGPATHSKEKIEELFNNGMTTIRMNFSHGDHKEQGERIEFTKAISKKLNKPISLLLDTKGPEIRVGEMENGKAEIKQGTIVTIYTSTKDYKNKKGNATQMTVSYDMSQDLKVGDQVLVDDGKLQLDVKEVKPGIVVTNSKNSHVVKTNKRINLPGVDFSMDFLAEKDIDDIKFGAKMGVDYIAASFVNRKENVEQIRKILKAEGAEHIQIISKIESQIGCDNIDSIIEASDGIMIARGDLGLEIPYYEVPFQQKTMIRKCREAGKIVIMATQMLESMTDNPHPTRAEVTDVYLATELGSDSTMLSGESAAGDFPAEAVNVMATINKRAEREFYSKHYYEKQLEKAKATTSGPRANIASILADKTKLGEYEYAVVLSKTGELLKTISKFRPNVTILGVSPDEKLYNAFGIWHSIFMNKVEDYEKFKVDQNAQIEIAKKWGAKKGEKILFVHNTDITEINVK